jgi:hypothetical protein
MTVVRIPRALEPSHTAIMGDNGTGKSSLIRQRLCEIEDRGETAVVLDQALEFTSQFYDHARGDVILNPLDARMPFWSPTDELRVDAEALTLARSLYPERPRDQPFFVHNVQNLIAFLLTCHPDSPQELLRWCLNEHDELDVLVAGSTMEKLIAKTAPVMRASILASLNEIANALQLLPADRVATGRWSANNWSTRRQGWIFLTSTAPTRASLAPLMGLWLDTLILRLMNDGRPDTSTRRVSFVLDELASLPKLQNLPTALAEFRKSGHPVLIGFQGRGQIDARYGKEEADVMLAQPATKVFLRTSESHSAQWIEDTIGKVEMQRVSEGRTTGRNAHHTHNLVPETKPRVMASEISGLPNMTGYLKVGNLVTRITFPYLALPQKCEAFIERPTKPRPTRGAAPQTLPDATTGPQHEFNFLG